MSIRRANLDAINGKSRNTISGHKRRTRELVDNAVRINKTPTLEPRGPFPLVDQVGMGLAVDIIQKSLVTSGRNERVIQAETLRQLRSTFTKNWESSPKGVAESASFGSGQGRVRPTSCPAQSEWYQDFWRGVEKRMGHKSLANHALEMAAMVKCIELIKADASTAESEEDANYLWKVGAFLTVCTTASLRGYEGFYLSLAELRKHQNKGRGGSVPKRMTKNRILSEAECRELPHVVLPLRGKFKNEIGIDYHMFNVASETQSGLEPRWWMDKLVAVCESEGRTTGPVFATLSGRLADSSDYDATFRSYLQKVQDTTGLIDKDFNVHTMFGISRTPRKTTTSRAKRAGFNDKLDEFNRWKKSEDAQNRKVRHKMSVLYSEAVLMMPVTWRVSYYL